MGISSAVLIEPMNDDQNPPDFTGRREPRPAEESVPPDAVEQARAPPAGADDAAIVVVPVLILATHLDRFREGPPPLGVLLVQPPEPGARRRGEPARAAAAPAGEEEDEEGEEEAVDEGEGGPQRSEDGDYAVAGARGQLIHLHLRRHRRRSTAEGTGGLERERGNDGCEQTTRAEEGTKQRLERERERDCLVLWT